MIVTLRVIAPGRESRDLTLNRPQVTIGRDPACDVSFEDAEGPGVSWLHARIEETAQGLRVHDFNSTNATLVNGTAIQSQALLKTGDTIQFGRNGPKIVVLVVEHEPRPTVAANVAKLTSRMPEATRDPLTRAAIVAAVAVVIFVAVLTMRVANSGREKVVVKTPEKAVVVPKPLPPPPVDLARWTQASLILGDKKGGAVALSASDTPTGLMIHILDRVKASKDYDRVMNAAWDSHVPIIESIPRLVQRLLEQNPGTQVLPAHLHQELVTLFPPTTKLPPGELVELRDPTGQRQLGYRLGGDEEGFDFRPFNRTGSYRVASASLEGDAVRVLSQAEGQMRIPIQYAVLSRLLRLHEASGKPQYVNLAIAYGPTVDRTFQQDFEQLLVDSPLQFEMRPDLADFPVIGRSARSRIDLATARERRLLGVTHLLLVDTQPTERAAPPDVKQLPDLIFRQIELTTGNVLWQERGTSAPKEVVQVAKRGIDLPYLLQSGDLSIIRFRDRQAIPPNFQGLVRGPFATNDFRIAFVEKQSEAGYEVRPLFSNDKPVELAAKAIKEIQAIDPDVLTAEMKGYDPWFASWKIARHLLPAAGRVTRVNLPLVEIDIGRKFGPKIDDEFLLRRLPAEGEPLALSILPVRLKIREVRERLTLAEVLTSPNDTYRPAVGDIAIHAPRRGELRDPGSSEPTIAKPRVAFLQIRTASQGSKADVECVPLLGPVLHAAHATSADRRAYYAQRLAAELEGVLIRLECDVADHSQLWLRMRDRDQLHGPTSLERIVAQLHEKFKITHVVQADLVTASSDSRHPNYAVFTVTEIARSDDGVIGRQVSKLEIEFPD